MEGELQKKKKEIEALIEKYQIIERNKIISKRELEKKISIIRKK